jgi:hypothetical protein
LADRIECKEKDTLKSTRPKTLPRNQVKVLQSILNSKTKYICVILSQNEPRTSRVRFSIGDQRGTEATTKEGKVSFAVETIGPLQANGRIFCRRHHGSHSKEVPPPPTITNRKMC